MIISQRVRRDVLKHPCVFVDVAFLPSCCVEGKTLSDIERSWVQLERAEHEREGALQEALLRLEQLEQLAQKFCRKVRPSAHLDSPEPPSTVCVCVTGKAPRLFTGVEVKIPAVKTVSVLIQV